MLNNQENLNSVTIKGLLLQRDALRYTPAGVPIVNIQLQHESQLQQNEFKRQLNFQFHAVALGDNAMQLTNLPIGSKLICKGFLAPKHHQTEFLVIHIQQFQLFT